MGYTHYYSQKRAFTADDEWAEVSADIREILTWVQNGRDTPLGNGHGNPGTHPKFTKKDIMFNGVGDEDSHETFVIYRHITREWEGGTPGHYFCKTARKPYDLAVTACLCYLDSVAQAYDTTSDGYGSDFVAGLAAAREALPQKANILDIPMEVMKSDRWTGPWISNWSRGSGYEVKFCINGKAYVFNKTGDVRCFQTHGELGQFLAQHQRAVFRSGGTSTFGGYGKIEPDIWNATGSFDQARHARIARAQAKVLRTLFPVDPQHAEKPPAFVRPGELPRPQDNGTFHYSLSDLIASLDTSSKAVAHDRL